MNERSIAWLTLREEADSRARNPDLCHRLAAHFAMRETITVADLNAGIGANLRAVSGHLPARQDWTLIDPDPAALVHARTSLQAWADSSEQAGDDYVLIKNGKSIAVRSRCLPCPARVQDILSQPCDLLTASTLFEQATPRYMRDLTTALSRTGTAIYAVLTGNGQQAWTPRHPLDNAMRAAAHAYQMAGPATQEPAGPTAPNELADALAMAGYIVAEGNSDWHLGPADAPLLDMYAKRLAMAAATTGQVAEHDITRWLTLRRTAAITGHMDTLALPPSGSTTLEPDADEL